ncbi:MAG: PHP domain-containing protein [Calditerrivibrio sp.]|nr:PHP domain-containing protein [Calditerrivibrio sp.]MCA1932037.1 PHP domain-containing protein [Calditerrivibrio sp.]
MVDLHCHSNFSDGTLNPEEILKLAEKIGLNALALTDHDTVDGIDIFMNGNSKVKRIPGVEISVDYDDGTFHMVGLFIDYNNKDLLSSLEQLKKFRKERNVIIINMLSELLGRVVDIGEIDCEAYGELGRPHIAKFMRREGIVSSIEEAFDKYLGKGKKIYVDKKRLSVEDSIRLIKSAGGLSILAHPVTLGKDDRFNLNFFRNLKDMGLDGIESFCSLHSEIFSKKYLNIAKELELLVSAGSDFHGENKDSVYLGVHGCSDSDFYFNKMLERLEKNG